MSWQRIEAGWWSFFREFCAGGLAALLLFGGMTMVFTRTIPTPQQAIDIGGPIFGFGGLLHAAINWRKILAAFGNVEAAPPPTASVSTDQRAAFWHEAKVPVARGAVLGIALVLGALWLGILPFEHGWYDVAWLGFAGFGGGAYLGMRPAALKYGAPMGFAPDDLSDAAAIGGLVGAAVVGLAVAALNLVINGSYDSAYTLAGAIAGAFLGAPVNAWRRCIQFKRFPRTRVVIGALLSAIAGAALVWGFLAISIWSKQKQLDAFWTVVGSILRNVSGDKWFGVRAITAVGALLGLGTYFWWQFGRPGRPSFRIRWSGAGSALDAIVETTPKLVSFTRGLLWTMLAFIVWQIASWWWTNFGVPGSISQVLGYMIYGGAAVALWKGLVELRTALKGKPTLQNEGVHGGARDATPDEAHRAARGGGGQSSIDDRRFRA
jgi:hypothetical protein